MSDLALAPSAPSGSEAPVEGQARAALDNAPDKSLEDAAAVAPELRLSGSAEFAPSPDPIFGDASTEIPTTREPAPEPALDEARPPESAPTIALETVTNPQTPEEMSAAKKLLKGALSFLRSAGSALQTIAAPFTRAIAWMVDKVTEFVEWVSEKLSEKEAAAQAAEDSSPSTDFELAKKPGEDPYGIRRDNTPQTQQFLSTEDGDSSAIDFGRQVDKKRLENEAAACEAIGEARRLENEETEKQAEEVRQEEARKIEQVVEVVACLAPEAEDCVAVENLAEPEPFIDAPTPGSILFEIERERRQKEGR